MNVEEEEALKKTLKKLIEIKKQQNAELEKSIESKEEFIFFIGVGCIISGLCIMFGFCVLIWSLCV
jgi:hypothetical protein